MNVLKHTYYTYLEFPFTTQCVHSKHKYIFVNVTLIIHIKVLIFKWKYIIYSKNIHLFHSRHCISGTGISMLEAF